MDKYIGQLIEDIKESAARSPFAQGAEILPREDNFEEDMMKLELPETENDTIEKYVEILLEQLPSEEKMKHRHLEKLIPALEELLIAYRIFPEYPEPTPLKVRYHLLREAWQEPMWMLRSGGLHMDFCTGSCEGCKLLEYCNTGQEVLAGNTDFEVVEEEEMSRKERKDYTMEELFPDYPNSENFIPGVYNYCNRWCERCRFTDRCLQRAREFEEERKSGEEQDLLKSVQRHMEMSIQMLGMMAEEAGISLEDIRDEQGNDQRAEEKMQQHELFLKSKQYGMEVLQWLKSDLVKKMEEENEDCRSQIKVIHWYKFFIHVKIARGLKQKHDASELCEYRQADANGSVKVAIIGLEESIKAWEKLLDFIPQERDEILDFINMTTKIRQNLMLEFPDALSFTRPGLDEVDVQD